MIEGLNLLIKDAKVKGRIRGINISANMTLNHLFFFNDVVLFGTHTVDEWMAFDVILETFCSASGMNISLDKWRFLFSDLDQGILHDIQHFMPFKADLIQLGF